jgi:oligopeptide/dipeptide ABC transporter ATP-binding protein
LGLKAREAQAIRGAKVAMIFQDPMSALNPLLRVGVAIGQVVTAHQRVTPSEARKAAIALMERVGIEGASTRWRAYPHEFSGGMRQRILIAMALASQPALLLADEPTTALDVLVQKDILDLLDSLRRERGMSLILVSHDMAVVAGACDSIGVMYAGRLVETGPSRQVLLTPQHPYTKGLLASDPASRPRGALEPIPGQPPEAPPPGDTCAFASRCTQARPACTETPVVTQQTEGGRTVRCLYPLTPSEEGQHDAA